MSNDMERERPAFEAWCLSEGSPFCRWRSPSATQRLTDGGYCYMAVGNAWASWQAARATPAPAEAQARRFHEAYERLAPSFGYETRPETRAFDPESPNGRLMIAVCAEVAAPPTAGAEREAWKPIETAPKDGSYFLVTNEKAGSSWVARWQPVAVSGYRFDQPWGSVMLNHEHLHPAGRYLRPTLWMPLPVLAAAPSAPSDQQGGRD